MILTGEEIKKQVKLKNICIKPFNSSQVNPNSYNYRLGDKILVLDKNHKFIKKDIPENGFVIKPHQTYLASTYEVLGSRKYAMSLIGRSSMGRLGLFLQISANLGHTGSNHKWTLELVASKPLKIYKNMIIGQISFWHNYGDIKLYRKKYSQFNWPKTSRLRLK